MAINEMGLQLKNVQNAGYAQKTEVFEKAKNEDTSIFDVKNTVASTATNYEELLKEVEETSSKIGPFAESEEDFNNMDKDGDGQIDFEEYMFGEMDANGDGQVDFEEFQQYMNGQGEGEAEAAEEVPTDALETYDKDGDGKLNDEEMQEYINANKYDLNGDGEVTDEEKQTVKEEDRMNRYDMNGDGKISNIEAFIGAIKDGMDKVKYDTDSDGNVSDTERAMGKYDEDGDGLISEEELENYKNDLENGDI